MALSDFEKFGITLPDVLAGGYKYAIGLDLGDGEVTASYIRFDAPVAEPRDLKLVNKGSGLKILSGIYIYDSDNSAVIGTMEQLKNYSEEKGHLYINFKANPRRLAEGELFEGSEKPKAEIVKRFAFECLSAIRRFNSDYDFSGRGILAVGCPSSPDWLRDGRDVDYARMIAEAIAPVDLDLTVMVMPESRASLMKVYKENLDPSLRERLREGVIVLDCGSSTFDVTYINFAGARQIDGSIPLGAALIDKRMTRNLMAAKGYGPADIPNPLQTRLHVRDAKEAYYIDPNNAPKVFIEINDEDVVMAKINNAFMGRVENEDDVTYSTESQPVVRGPWSMLHRSYLTHCRDEIRRTSGSDFEGVVMLTGGASLMRFVQDNTRSVFDSPKVVVVEDPKPSFCVSRGLAWATYTDMLALKLIDTAKKQIAEKIQAKTDTLRADIAKRVADIVYDYINESMERWVEDGDGVSVAQLSKNIEQGFNDPSAPGAYERKARLDEAVQGAIRHFLQANTPNSARGQIVEVVNSLFDKYFPGKINQGQLAKFELRDDDWRHVISSLTTDSSLSLSSSIINNIDIEGELVQLFKVVGKLLMAGLYVMGLGLIDELLLDGRGSKWLDKMFDSDKSKPLSRDDRKKAYDGFVKNKAKTLESIKRNFSVNSMTPEMRRAFSEQLVAVLTPVIDKAVDNVSLYY